MSSYFFDTIVLKYRFLLLVSHNLRDRHFDVAWKIEQFIL